MSQLGLGFAMHLLVNEPSLTLICKPFSDTPAAMSLPDKKCVLLSAGSKRSCIVSVIPALQKQTKLCRIMLSLATKRIHLELLCKVYKKVEGQAFLRFARIEEYLLEGPAVHPPEILVHLPLHRISSHSTMLSYACQSLCD